MFQKNPDNGHDERQAIKNEICKKLSDLLSMQEVVCAGYKNKELGVLKELKKRGLEKGLDDDKSKRGKMTFLKRLIEIRN